MCIFVATLSAEGGSARGGKFLCFDLENPMKSIREELVQCSAKIAKALMPASGGSLSAREGDMIWMQPQDLAMDEIGPDDLCGLDLKTGTQKAGKNKPALESNMHLAVYRVRTDVKAVFHTHSAWVTGVISAGKKFKPMFAEFVNDLGRSGSVPYFPPTSPAMEKCMEKCAKNHDTIFMINHGMLAVGVNLKQALYRCVVAEDAAKSLFAASIAGKPLFLNQQRVNKILSLDAVKHRTKMMEKK